MKNTKLLASIVGTTFLVATGISYAATPVTEDTVTTSVEQGVNTTDEMGCNGGKKGMHKMGQKGGHRGMHKFGPKLTDEEKVALESMSDEEKKEFMSVKMQEHKLEIESRETIIDKLLSGETLTAEEETIKQEIITERAERKAQREIMESIKTKIDNGETLTAQEEELIKEKGPKRK